MRLRKIAGLASATSVVLGIIGMPGYAVADSSTLYVDNSNTAAHCGDTGAAAGSTAQPFCTVQAAADAAQPGQTVRVANGYYDESVTITHSGAPGRPITFLGGTLRDTQRPIVGTAAGGVGRVGHAFVVKGVQDIRISGFGMTANAETVLVGDSARVVLDQNQIWSTTTGQLAPATVRLTGTTSDSAVSRNRVYAGQASVLVDPGVTGALVNGNAIDNPRGGGVRITDAPGAVVTANTVSTLCAPAIALQGGSGKATVENNVLAANWDDSRNFSSCDHPADGAKLVVSAGSTTGTYADYNLVNPLGDMPVYSWADRPFAGSAEFAKAVPGQGAHDLTADPQLGSGLDQLSTSPAIDSADADAPGEPTTDLLGYHAIDDPSAADTGHGGGYRDRGAFEFTTSTYVSGLGVDQQRVPVDTRVTFHGTPYQTWSPAVSYAYDFGDGTPPVTGTDAEVTHAYRAAGSYRYTVTATLANGDTLAATDTEVVSPDAPLVPVLKIVDGHDPLEYWAEDGGTTTPWTVTGRTYDYGDGSAPDSSSWSDHLYSREGDYTVTMTVTDSGGRTARTSKVVHVGYRPSVFHALAPKRVLDTRQQHTTLGPGQSIDVRVFDQQYPVASAVVLNVTAVSHSGGGYLTVYPKGSDRPKTSNVNFTAGQVVPNLVTVLAEGGSTVTVFNHSGDTDVVIDIFGYYEPNTGVGDRFTAQAPSRLLDTRAPGHSPVAAGSPVELPVRGQHGVPADATAVVLNVTATRGTKAGYFSLYPEAGKPTGTSNLNFAAGQTVANQVVVPVGSDGKVRLSNFQGSADAVVDLFGYYGPHGDSLFKPATPVRLVDTREAGHGALGAGQSIAVGAGAPAGATGAVLNVTATAPTAPGYLTVWADGADRPGTSNLNFLPGQTVPNHVTTPLSPAGKFDVYNFHGNTQVVADLFGYFVKG
ncbi:hypothetical protein CFP65_6881 [Kitasatospora sp. MMS16-BH015]|uniref:PKD domain-containing protein n=1 Tax=Kitasatospora sp. MMS16-BH015 TaxID=2018025 RepID=UPI000CA257B8|nr:right-handed parallel beta-helix repeat-containing protein [Kitasatospora sp. MMS16-BH015]AUG81506.1 hypothetical protein CFP65_6881 [Kitasatospora sp. MMS16-BH015]